MTESTLGQRIARQRKMLSLSQEAFGEKMGVSRQAASKWESDAAVPEIDKLINMSKLFGVSVGWLLGLEDADEPSGEDRPEPDEQILFSFQPPQTEPDPQTPDLPEQPVEPAYEPVPEDPQKKRKNWLTTFCAIVAVVSIILNVISMALYDRLANKIAETASEPTTQDPAIAELEEQISKLKEEYATTQEQINRSLDRIILAQAQQDSIYNDIREFMEMYGEGASIPTPDSILPVYDNLSKWSLTAQKTTDFTQITLHFSANSTVNLQAARLDVLKNGETLTSANCTMAGKHLLGVLTLSPDSGLEYRLVLTHADKTTQTITLEGHGLSDLEVLSQPIVRTTPKELYLFPDKQYFMQGWLNIYVSVPHLAAEDAQYEWSNVRISYYQNDVHMSDTDLSQQLEAHSSWEHRVPYLSSQIPAQSFQMQYFEEHDVHTLYLKGTLTVNGVPMEFSAPLREWVVRDGQFFSVNDQ